MWTNQSPKTFTYAQELAGTQGEEKKCECRGPKTFTYAQEIAGTQGEEKK